VSESYRLAGVMGWPIAHSRSPVMHRHWLEHYGLAGDYVKLPVQPRDLERALRALPALGFVGCNLTLPHKGPALALIDEIEPMARRIGAVNTVTIGTNGKLRGGNSDARGFIENLRAEAPGWRVAAGPAVLLGAGGAARAVAAALIDAGVPELRLVNRDAARAEAAATMLGGPIRVMAWQDRAAALAGAALFVNTTSLGMVGSPPLDLPLHYLAPDAVVDELVYAPLETSLLRAARARGNIAVDGLGMLLHQGRPGFAQWFGVMPDVTPELRARMAASLGS
jgi:shikimate dehydrogenase